MRAIKENAYAKINLFLDVVAKRDDGFHEVNTVMHSVSLCDTLTVSIAPSAVRSVTLSVVGNDRLVTDEKNLAVRAAWLYLERASMTAEVRIKLEKRIPVAAGLAGGSSDAAATLRAMNKLFGRYFSDRALHAVALELGSDVPYCLFGGTVLCQGRGELMTPLSPLKLHTVIAVTDEYVSTPAAYAALDAIYSNFDGSIRGRGPELFESMLESASAGRLERTAVYNIFEDAAFGVCKKSEALKSKMRTLGAVASAMSGSGPSVFGIFATEEDARRAVQALSDGGTRAYYAVSV